MSPFPLVSQEYNSMVRAKVPIPSIKVKAGQRCALGSGTCEKGETLGIEAYCEELGVVRLKPTVFAMFERLPIEDFPGPPTAPSDLRDYCPSVGAAELLRKQGGATTPATDAP
jgi:hypothetical protein